MERSNYFVEVKRPDEDLFETLYRPTTLFEDNTLNELPMQELRNLAKEIKSWPDYVGEYKGREVWGAKALEFCEKRSREEEKLKEEIGTMEV